MFSLDFCSAGKGPFTTGKAKKIGTTQEYVSEDKRRDRRQAECGKGPRSCWEIRELTSLKCHSLNIRPGLRKLAVVTFSEQIKPTDCNSVFNVLFPECVAHKKKSCAYLRKSTHSFIFLWHVIIGSDHNLCIFSKYFFNFSKPSGHCRR